MSRHYVSFSELSCPRRLNRKHMWRHGRAKWLDPRSSARFARRRPTSSVRHTAACRARWGRHHSAQKGLLVLTLCTFPRPASSALGRSVPLRGTSGTSGTVSWSSEVEQPARQRPRGRTVERCPPVRRGARTRCARLSCCVAVSRHGFGHRCAPRARFAQRAHRHAARRHVGSRLGDASPCLLHLAVVLHRLHREREGRVGGLRGGRCADEVCRAGQVRIPAANGGRDGPRHRATWTTPVRARDAARPRRTGAGSGVRGGGGR